MPCVDTCMGKSVGLLTVLCIAGCEHIDTIDAASVPPPAPGMSSSIEVPTLSADVVEHLDPPPPPPKEPWMLRRERLQQWFSLLSMEAQTSVGQVCTWRVRNPCGVILTGGVDPEPEMLSDLDEPEQAQAYNYCDTVRPGPRCNTPLVIAFDSEPVAFSGHLPSPTTPWLALDRDGDGNISSRGELFGDATVLADGTVAANGFVALADLDANHDGVIDVRDPAFSRLVLWADGDGDQRSSAGELRPASELVVAIPLANHRDVRCTANDDCEGERGAVQWRGPDGSERQGAVIDVYTPSR